MADVRTLLLERARQIRGQKYIGPEIPYWDKPMRQYGPPPPPDYGQPPQPQPQTVQETMQLPEDWDYRNPERAGPLGEVLPRGAVSWTPYGTPYYGDGLQGWLKGAQSRITAPIGDRPDTLIPQNGTFWQKTLGTFQNMSNWFYNVGGEEGGAPSPLTYGTRLVSEGVGGLLSGLGEFAKKTEQTFGVMSELNRLVSPPTPTLAEMEQAGRIPSGWMGDYVRKYYDQVFPYQKDQRPQDLNFEEVKSASHP